MARTLRSFIALELSGEIRTKTRRLIESLRPTTDNVKWVAEPSLHLTLKFLGEIDYRDVAQVDRALQGAVSELPPFLAELRGTGAFPTLERPRTIWVGVGEGADEIIELHGRVEERLAPLGFRSEHRKFRPHVTIGRVRHSPLGEPALAEQLAAQRDFLAGTMDVGEVVLFSSTLGREGPSYEVLSTVELAGK